MRDKLNKLKSLLQGDSNPKWTALVEVLEAIVNRLDNKVGSDIEGKLDHLDYLFDSVYKKVDNMFDRLKCKIKWEKS